MVEVGRGFSSGHVSGGHHQPVGGQPGEVVTHGRDAIAVVRTGGHGGQRQGERTCDAQGPVAVHGSVASYGTVNDVLRPDVGGPTHREAVNQRGHVRVVGGHSNPNVNGGVLERVQGQRCGQREVGVARNGLLIGVENVDQQLRPVGLFVPAVQPPVAKQRVGGDGARNPCTRGFEDIDLNTRIVDVPAVALHVGV